MQGAPKNLKGAQSVTPGSGTLKNLRDVDVPKRVMDLTGVRFGRLLLCPTYAVYLSDISNNTKILDRVNLLCKKCYKELTK